MSRHPAPEELLLDYATGTLAEGPALAVALHVALDPKARRTVDGLAALGGALLESETAPVDESGLAAVLARLDDAPIAPRPAAPAARAGFEWAPALLRPYVGTRNWKRVFGGFERIDLALHGDRHRVSLLRLQPGQGLPQHRHVAGEYTVVLQGGYTDNTGSYRVGDFAIGPGAAEHEPIADPGDACIALIVLERPIVLTGRWARFLNPLLRWGWM
jgi:putative transcriptional regulator